MWYNLEIQNSMLIFFGFCLVITIFINLITLKTVIREKKYLSKLIKRTIEIREEYQKRLLKLKVKGQQTSTEKQKTPWPL